MTANTIEYNIPGTSNKVEVIIHDTTKLKYLLWGFMQATKVQLFEAKEDKITYCNINGFLPRLPFLAIENISPITLVNGVSMAQAVDCAALVFSMDGVETLTVKTDGMTIGSWNAGHVIDAVAQLHPELVQGAAILDEFTKFNNFYNTLHRDSLEASFLRMCAFNTSGLFKDFEGASDFHYDTNRTILDELAMFKAAYVYAIESSDNANISKYGTLIQLVNVLRRVHYTGTDLNVVWWDAENVKQFATITEDDLRIVGCKFLSE